MISTLFRSIYASAALLGALMLAPPSVTVTPTAWAQTEVAKSDYAAALGWYNNRQGAFLTAAIQDSRGDIWVSTEDKGVWRYDARGQKWIGFNAANGLGDDTAYALCEDGRGRIWVGTLNGGVAVWNGRDWKSYGVLDGPLGEHIFALASDPSSGDVWMATNAGLSRYVIQSDSWKHYTRAQGLPSDQISSIAFDELGNIYAGTQSDGLLIAKSFDDYAGWQQIQGATSLPLAPEGAGLPSNKINDVAVTDDDKIWVATSMGVAQSGDGGQSWNFLRGGDWKDKVRGLYRVPQWDENPAQSRELMREDYATTLAQDARGLLWVGYRQRSFQIRRPLVDRVLLGNEEEKGGEFPYVSALLPLQNGSFLVAFYGQGLTVGPPVPSYVPAPQEREAIANRRGWRTPSEPRLLNGMPLPKPDAVPTVTELQALTAQINALNQPMAVGSAVVLGEDWRTQGDWVGRYGRRKALLCATSAPFDADFVVKSPFVNIVGELGPHYKNDDSIRRWIQWIKTENPRTLYHPQLGYRRQAEWDDHGEVYPLTFEGPDLWATVEVPAGTYRLSSYFFNKDGHMGFNRARDYSLELRAAQGPIPPWPAPAEGEEVTGEWLQTKFGDYYAEREKLIAAQMETPPLAQTRVRDFWGGVHKQFVVRGPATYWLKVGRNYSFNTIVSSIMLDEIGPDQTWTDDVMGNTFGGSYNPPDPEAPEAIDPHLLDKILAGTYRAPGASTPDDKARADVVKAARTLWDAAENALDKQGGAQWNWRARVMAYRAAAANDAPAKLLENWRWKMPLWTAADRTQWNADMTRNYDYFIKINPAFKDANF